MRGLDQSEQRLKAILSRNRRAQSSALLRISLCNLCVLCVSVVVISHIPITTEIQRTQRLHREELGAFLWLYEIDAAMVAFDDVLCAFDAHAWSEH